MVKNIIILFTILLCCFKTKAQDIAVIINSNISLQQKTDSLLTLANRQKAMGNYEVMEKYLNAANSLITELNNPETFLRYYSYKGAMLDLQRKDKQQVNELQKALAYIDKVKDPEYKRSTFFFLAKSYWHLREYDSANKYFNLTEKLHNTYKPYNNWYVYAEKALMYQDVENTNLAQTYFEKAYALTKEKGIRMDHGIMLNNLLTFYSYYKMPKKYAETLAEQTDFISKRKNPSMGPSIHDVMYSNLDKMKLEEKIIFLTEVKNALQKQGDVTNSSYVNIQMAKLYEDDGQPQKALAYINENMELSFKTGYIINHFIAAKSKYRLLTKTGNYDEAGKLFDYIFKLKDSLNLTDQQNKLQELEIKYQTEKKQQEIIILNSKNELSKKEIDLLKVQTKNDSIILAIETEKRKALFKQNLLKEMALEEGKKNNALLARQNILKDSIVKSEYAYNQLLVSENELKKSELDKEQALKASLQRENNLQTNQLTKEKQIKWGLIASSSLLLLSGLSIFGLYRKQKQKNNLIQKQSTDLEVLMKEIHHRVKNNLQVVSSLLDLQSHSITDSQAHEAVKEGKNRVQSMALIHQNLYSEGNIKGIKLKEYVTNLLQTLCDSYNISNDKVKINANIDNLNLDVDTMIPLGLVLNELVSNAFKYAFNKNQHGELNILLKEQANQLHLMVSDNGGGFPIGMDVKTSKSFGLKMIRAFAQKLKATLDIYNNDGAVVEMKIAKFKTA